jgi:hypothetical protein
MFISYTNYGIMVPASTNTHLYNVPINIENVVHIITSFIYEFLDMLVAILSILYSIICNWIFFYF